MSMSSNPICGVYCYYRDNKPVYVGCSIDIKRRSNQHKNKGRFLDCEMVILEETTTEEVFERERHWIRELNTLQDGENKVLHNNMDDPELRSRWSERMKRDNPMHGRTNSGSFKKGNVPVITPERNEKIRQSKLGERNHNHGKKGLFDHINNHLLECPVCHKKMTKGNFNRWGHGPNCKK